MKFDQKKFFASLESAGVGQMDFARALRKSGARKSLSIVYMWWKGTTPLRDINVIGAGAALAKTNISNYMVGQCTKMK